LITAELQPQVNQAFPNRYCVG